MKDKGWRGFIGTLKCLVGWHVWNATRPIGIMDGFPPPCVPYDNPRRTCRRCDKHQRWLPGYGGSEWGCWLNDTDPANAPLQTASGTRASLQAVAGGAE